MHKNAIDRNEMHCEEARYPHDERKPGLVGVKACLEILFPHKASRPSLRTWNEWKRLGYFPSIKIAKRVFLDPQDVREALDERFQVEATD